MRKIILVFVVSLIVVSCSGNIPVSPTLIPTNVSTVTSTSTPVPTTTPAPTSTPTPLPTPVGGASGKLIFIYNRIYTRPEGKEWVSYDVYETAFPELKGDSNLFVSNWDGTDLTPITTEGFSGITYIEAISPDGKKILALSYPSVGQMGDLFLVKLDDLDNRITKIADHIMPTNFGGIKAIWLDNSSIAYIGTYGGEKKLWRINLDGGDRLSLSKNIEPFGIFSINPNLGIVWRGDTWDSIQISSLDGTDEYTVSVIDQWYFARNDYSPDGKWIFWQVAHPENPDNHTQPLYVSPLSDELENPKLIGNLPTRYHTVIFSSDGSKAVFLPSWGSKASDQSLPEDVRHMPIYTLSLKTFELRELFIPDYDELNFDLDPALSSVSLSPDGKLILITSHIFEDNGPLGKGRYFGGLPIKIVNLDTFASSDEFMKNVSTSAIRSIFWLR